MKRIKFLSSFVFLFLYFLSSVSSQCTLACYSNLNVSLDASGSAILTPVEVLAYVPPTCGSLSVSPNTFNCADVGSTIFVLVTETTSGNSCFSHVLIEDKFSPTISCISNLVTNLPMDGTFEIYSTTLLLNESDNCPLTYNIVPDVLTCANVGLATTVTITATDPGGNSATCFTTVDLQVAPVALACYSNLNVSLDASGLATLTPAEVLASIPPTCANLSVSPNMFNCADVGSTIFVVLTDAFSGNSCFSNILIEDKITPTISCISNLVTNLPMDGTFEIYSTTLLLSESDNCPLTYNIVPDVLTCANVGLATTVTLTATDPGGNSATCFTTVDLQVAPVALACYSNLNVSLDASGMATLTPADILASIPPICANLSVSPNTFNCADVGSTIFVEVTDAFSGNSCFTHILIEDKSSPLISCNALTNVQLGVGGVLVLDANDLLASYSDNCNLSFVISPTQVDCSDKGNTVAFNITASDPGGNTVSCFGDIFVEDPKPSSCMINVPSSVPCGASGVGFGVTLVGGNGPFTYDWSIKGNPNGWSITGGQGTPNITMDVGIKKIKLAVKITDVCGKTVKCQIKVTCNNSAFKFPGGSDQSIQLRNASNMDFKIFPNPVLNNISWRFSDDDTNDEDRYQIINIDGKVVADGKTSVKTLNIQSLPSGVYYFQIISEKNVLTKRFAKI